MPEKEKEKWVNECKWNIFLVFVCKKEEKEEKIVENYSSFVIIALTLYFIMKISF